MTDGNTSGSVNGVISFLKSPYLSLVVATLGAVILFAPDQFAEKMGFAQIRNNHIVASGIPARTIVGIVTTVSGISFLYLTCVAAWRWNSGRRYENEFVESLRSLSPGELTILRYCYVMRQQSVSLEVTDSAANSLASREILFRGPVVNVLAVPFLVRDSVWRYILVSPEVLFHRNELEAQTMPPDVERLHRHIERYNWRS